MATETLEIALPASVKDLANLIKKTYNDDEIDELGELIFGEEYIEPTKEELIADLKEAIEEVNLHKAGKIKLRTVEELIKEMEEEEKYVKLPKRELIKKLIMANEQINYNDNYKLIVSPSEESINNI